MLLEPDKQIVVLYPVCRISFGLIGGDEGRIKIDGDEKFLTLNMAVQR
jgi:hypothetical protein